MPAMLHSASPEIRYLILNSLTSSSNFCARASKPPVAPAPSTKPSGRPRIRILGAKSLCTARSAFQCCSKAKEGQGDWTKMLSLIECASVVEGRDWLEELRKELPNVEDLTLRDEAPGIGTRQVEYPFAAWS